MRSILVYADRSPATAGCLNAALALADARGGHLTVMVDTPIARYIAMDPMGGSYAASAAMQDALAADDEQAAALEARLAGGSVPFRVIRGETEPVPALAAAARLADLIVVSRASGIGAELALMARAPVLVLPDRTVALPPARIAIAWDTGAEAAIALRSALPFLEQAASVEVLTVVDKPGSTHAREALDYLAQHGIAAQMQELIREGSTEATLAAAVSRGAPDLLVMGAYGRSRMREFLFGGVTRHFIEAADAPALLLAH